MDWLSGLGKSLHDAGVNGTGAAWAFLGALVIFRAHKIIGAVSKAFDAWRARSGELRASDEKIAAAQAARQAKLNAPPKKLPPPDPS